MNFIKKYGLPVVALIIAITALFTHGSYESSNIPTVGSVASSTSSTTNYPNIGLAQLEMNQNCDQSFTCSGLKTIVTGGTIPDNTNVLIAQPNPFQASSSVTQVLAYGTNGTTTVDFLIGTSTNCQGGTSGSATTSNSVLNTSISPSGIKALGVATSTNFFLMSGSGIGATTLSSTTFSSFVVGPTECLVGIATSTYSGATPNAPSANFGVSGVGNTFSGSIFVEWQR